MSIIIRSTNPPADEIVEAAREAYERRQALKAQQSAESSEDHEDDETQTDEARDKPL